MKHEPTDPLLRLHSAAIGAPKRAKPVTGPQPTHPMCAAMGRAYWVEADARLNAERYPTWHPGWRPPGSEPAAKPQAVGDGVTDDTAAIAAGAPLQAGANLADMIADCTPVSGAALVGTKPQPDADGWIPFECTGISGGCPVPTGIQFEGRFRDGRVSMNPRSDNLWQLLSSGRKSNLDIVAYRILPAKPAALPGWRKGPDVPASERVGMWFHWNPNHISGSPANPASSKLTMFSPVFLYRPAPPGVREGDAYDPALYGEEA